MARHTKSEPESQSESLPEATPVEAVPVEVPVASATDAEQNKPEQTPVAQPAVEQPATPTPERKPVHVIGPIPCGIDGSSVEVCVWDRLVTLQDGRQIMVYSVTSSCYYLYKDEVRRGGYFRPAQIDTLIWALQAARDWIAANKAK